MLILWRLVHTFGFILWFIGLFGTTAAQVAARKAPDAAARRGAWSVVRRLQPFEILGLVLTPIGGIFLTTTIYGHLFRGTPAFVHIKLLLVLIALVLNLVVILQRKKVEARLAAGDDAAFTAGVKRLAMLEGIATLMLPAAVVVVPATDADRAFVASVWRAVAPRYEPLLPGAFEAEARAVEERGLSLRYETLRIDVDGEPVGFAGLARLSPRHAYLAQLYLLPARQRRGIGTAALRLLEEQVRRDAEVLVLHVHRQADWARRFYERCGYGVLAADEAGSRAWAGGLLAGWTPPGTLLVGRTLR